MQAVPTYFSSVFADTPMDDSTKSIDWAEYRTSDLGLSSQYSQSTDNYQIVIKDTDQYLLMSQAYLLVRAKIIENGAALADGRMKTLSSGGAALFTRMELSANDKLIDTCENPQFVQLVNALLTYNRDKLDSTAASEWITIDSAPIVSGTSDAAVGISVRATEFIGASDTIYDHQSGAAYPRQMAKHTPADATHAVGAPHPLYNKGFMARWNRSRNDRTFEVVIPLRSVFGFCRDIQHVNRGIKWELNLYKNLKYASIIHGSNTMRDPASSDQTTFDATTLITKISLWVPQVTPQLETSLMLENITHSDAISEQYFENMSCRISDQYPSGTTDAEWIIPLEGHRPTRMIFGLQRLAQYNQQLDPTDSVLDGGGLPTDNDINVCDQTTANGATFSYLGLYNAATHQMTGGLIEAELRINSRSLPREKYRISFDDANPEYERLYIDFLKSGGKFSGPDGASISPKEYKDLYPLIAFDLRDYTDVFSGFKTNDIRFRCRLSGGQQTAFKIVAIIWSERKLTVQALNGKISLQV